MFLNKARLLACTIPIVTAISLYLLLEFTRMGKALRAAADNPTAATYMGIDTDKAYRIAFGLGSGITAIAGGLMATYLSFGPFIGLDYVIIMYSGVVLGGMGSILGAFWEASPSDLSNSVRPWSCRRNCRMRRSSSSS